MDNVDWIMLLFTAGCMYASLHYAAVYDRKRQLKSPGRPAKPSNELAGVQD